jgi:phage nucleotide-binding protein
MLIYGEPGAGKTHFGGTAVDHPATSPILVVDVEGGTATLRGKNVDVVQVRSMAQIEHIHNELASDTSNYYKTVFIDSLTELQKLDMRTVMTEQWNKKPDTTDIYVPSQREWGKSGERVRMVVRAFRDLKMNTIVSALLNSDRDDKTGLVSFYPSLPGKLRSEIPGFFDIVGLLTTYTGNDNGVVTIERQLQVVKTERVSAKDRFSALGAVLQKPTVPMIWDLIHKDQDPVNLQAAINAAKGETA